MKMARKPIKPGVAVSVSGILTLFLSIEVSKAMRTVKEAEANGDTAALKRRTNKSKSLPPNWMKQILF